VIAVVAEEGTRVDVEVDVVDETRDELDETDEMSDVVEEVKVDKPIVEFWQAARAARPTTPDKIEVFITMVTTSQGGVRMSECGVVVVENCLEKKFDIW